MYTTRMRLITSRPHACEDINAKHRINIIIGFDHEMKEFAETFFANAQVFENFLLQLNDYPHISGLCHIPIW